MFTHFDYPGKCEWLGGGLDAFVRHYNGKSGDAFALTACLDVVKISGATPKEPEVLLTDPSTGRRMVIERKSVVWPPNYLHRHRLEHDFANAIWKNAGDLFRDASYKLTLDTREFDRLSHKQIQGASQEIGSALRRIRPEDLPVSETKPLKWKFRKTYLGEEDDQRNGIIIAHEMQMALDDFDHEDAKAGTASETQSQLNAAATKFVAYLNDRKLVLLDFYGDELSEDDIPALWGGIFVPVEIDEIWRTIHNWASAEDYEIGYDRLYERGSGPHSSVQSNTGKP